MRHHGVKAAHFLHDSHRMPGLAQRVNGHRHDVAALPVLGAPGLAGLFEGVQRLSALPTR